MASKCCMSSYGYEPTRFWLMLPTQRLTLSEHGKSAEAQEIIRTQFIRLIDDNVRLELCHPSRRAIIFRWEERFSRSQEIPTPTSAGSICRSTTCGWRRRIDLWELYGILNFNHNNRPRTCQSSVRQASVIWSQLQFRSPHLEKLEKLSIPVHRSHSARKQ